MAAVASTSIGDPPKTDGLTISMLTAPTQLPLLSEIAADRSVRRTIHYLGSKLRLLDPIRQAVSSVAPIGQPVCDLFAGSGIVSLSLASQWDITSVDIQEYSRFFAMDSSIRRRTPAKKGTAYAIKRVPGLCVRD